MSKEDSPVYSDITPPRSRLGVIDIKEEDIIKTMLKLHRHKAVGPDNISPYVLREVPAFAIPLKILFEHSLTT